MQYNFLLAPLNIMFINQNFGDNKACIDIKTGKKTIYCDGLNPPKGYRSIYSKMKGHNGMDLRASNGTPIYAAHDGIITEYVSENERGLGLGITTNKKFNCIETGKKEYFKTRYWHNLINFKKLGDKVFVGDVIALADNTGYSSGSHLHFEMKVVDKTGNKNILQRNGFYGAIDPAPYLSTAKASWLAGAKNKKDRAFAILKLWISTK